MKIKFCGAAGTVTGSSHLITLDDGFKILLDCGLYQGNESKYENFNYTWAFNPAEIDVLILSHAHIDHCGRIPKFVADGYNKDIICTHATRNLANIMLLDSGYIQEKDVSYINERRKRKGLPSVEPLYTVAEAKKCAENFVGIGYNKWHSIHKNVEVKFVDAGHILGSASVTLRIKQEDGSYKTIGFSGDIGRPHRPILRDPQLMPQVDYLICESTYGGEEHSSLPNDKTDLLRIIREACVNRRGKLIIPAFSVGRTQELVYMMDQLSNEGLLPNIPVFVDSPLAIDATEIYMLHPECYDFDLLEYMANDPNPFGFRKLKYTRSVADSKAINNVKGPAIIISASGMMSAGRVKHHLSNNIEDPSTTILVVGYCAEGTLGRRIRDGEKEVRIFGETKAVNAHVEIMDSFSAHGDNSEMLDFLENQDREKLKTIFLVHGEPKKQQAFKESLHSKGFKHIEIPELRDVVKLY
ncbi:MAG: MBL fold metallo-hydrolase [Chitinophagales bacterium]|nr:MBL fold metallo-hydrolase [Chitinophagales bacterium]